jgi:uncharacterized damage-inducible protein DinB
MKAGQIAFDLVKHMEWADAVAWSSVLASETVRAHARVQRLLCHIHNVQGGFLSVWRGENPDFREPGQFASPSAMMTWGREGHERLQEFVSGTGRDELERVVRLPWAAEVLGAADRVVQHPTLEQSVFQVVTHSTHHRGQLNALLRSIDAEPQLTDYIVWIWRGRPAPPWPNRSSD